MFVPPDCAGSNAVNAPVAVVWPVPPLAIDNVPPRTIAPPAGELGVSPVVPAEKLVTAAVRLDHDTFAPFVVRKYPEAPVCEGRRLLIAFTAFVAPVPPFAIFNVPANTTSPPVGIDGLNPVDPPDQLVTPPPPDEAAIVIVPEPGVIVTFDPAVS